jgi:hypothetical protein
MSNSDLKLIGDKKNRNVVHALVGHRHDWTKLQVYLALFDKDAVEEMMLERCEVHPRALTPLAYWLSSNSGNDHKTHKIEILSKYSTGEDLEMINGEGDLPLHVAIKQGLSGIASFLISLNPSLLHRENATGRTALEMARDLYLTSAVQDPPNVFSNSHYNPGQEDYHSIVHRSPKLFIPAKPGPADSKKRTYEVCLEADEKMVREGQLRKRRLVSLFEANEVAKRLADNKKQVQAGRYALSGGRWHNTVEEADVVSEWLALSMGR